MVHHRYLSLTVPVTLLSALYLGGCLDSSTPDLKKNEDVGDGDGEGDGDDNSTATGGSPDEGTGGKTSGGAQGGEGGDVGSGGSTSNCSVNASAADPAIVAGLEKAMQLWTWTHEKNGEELTEIVDACDATTSYRVGPEVFVDGDTAHSYAECAVARGRFVEVSSGLLGAPEYCTQFACTERLGVIWNTATSGSVFIIDPETENPTGGAVFYLILQEELGAPYPGLLRSGFIGGQSGYLMAAQLENDAPLACP
jgi:hypothetical protein